MSALWTSAEIVAATGGTLHGSPFAASGVAFDSRAVATGDLFVALAGTAADGHGYVDGAFQRGAAAALVSREISARGPVVRVSDTSAGLTALARAARRRSRARVASVTGSVGKTSTKDALRAMLSPQGPTEASAASYNNHVGVPVSLACLPAEARFGVFEIGMNHPGEIEPLARMVEADVGIVTNVAAVHIGHMGSEEAIADEKACLFAGMRAGAVAVLNRDNRHYDRLAAHARRFGVTRIVDFGCDERAAARLLACKVDDSGSDIEADIEGRSLRYRLGAPGEHLALNSVAALAAVHCLGADVATAAAALRGWSASPGRGARRRLPWAGGGVELLDESYNASPIAVRAMLAVFARTLPGPSGRRILVLGDMRELGAHADAYHADLAPDVARSGAALVFTCGPHMKSLADRLDARVRGAHESDSAALAPVVVAALRPGDVVAVKGSLGSKMKTIVDALDQASAGGR